MLAALQGARFWLGRGKEALQSAGQLPGYAPTPRPDRRVRVLPYEIPAAVLSKLTARARQQGTTVQGALGAAQLLAIIDQFASKAARRLALNSLADLRGVIDAGLSEDDLGLYVSPLCTVHALGSNPDLRALAREIREGLKQIMDAGDANLINGVYSSHPLIPPGENLAKLVQSIAALGPPSSMFSNIGRVDDVDLGDQLTLKTLAFVVWPPAQHPVCVTAASYAGRMNMLYDEHKLSVSQAKAIGDGMVAHLQAAAGVAPVGST